MNKGVADMMFANEDLCLRAVEPEDLDWLYQVENDERLWEWGCSNVPFSRYALKTYIAECSHDIYADGQVRMVIASLKDGRVIGCADMVNFSPRHSRAEVGILIFPEYRRQGYAMKVLRMLASYARDFLYIHQLYAIVSERNHVAQHLFSAAGFRKTAALDGWLRDGVDSYLSAHLFTLIL